MSWMNFGPEQQRRLLELSFEPHEGGYLYYRNRRAGGVPVTAAERESYLSAAVLGSRTVFYRAIRGRAATAPPRKFGPVYWKILSHIPAALGAFTLILGAAFASVGFAGGSIAVRAAFAIFGVWVASVGAQIIYAKLGVRLGR